jgi:hypothetical protein
MEILRSVHAWNYRRYILAIGFPTRDMQSEIRYTTKKIEGNFSNFSAWHQRTKVFARLWDDLHRAEGTGARIKLDRMQEAGKMPLPRPGLLSSHEQSIFLQNLSLYIRPCGRIRRISLVGFIIGGFLETVGASLATSHSPVWLICRLTCVYSDESGSVVTGDQLNQRPAASGT